MKHMKRALCLMVVVVMMMSIIAFPASASTTVYGKLLEDFPTFPVLQVNSSGGYVRLLQRFLYVCPRTHETIYNTNNTNHGIDGGFGNRTKQAVIEFQTLVLGSSQADGIVGKNTWTAIYSILDHYQAGKYFYYNGEADWDRFVMWYSNSGSTYYLYTYDHNADKAYPYFRTFTL